MSDRELLSLDFIRLPPRALPENWIGVTPADVAEMLRHARVQEPWHEPEVGCFMLAQAINHPLGYLSLRRAEDHGSNKRSGAGGVNEGKPARTTARRAHDALEELRRALPSAIAEFENSLAQSFRIDFTSPQPAEHLRASKTFPGPSRDASS